MTAEFDIGPLSWVKGEIELALERAAETLTRAAADGDPAPLEAGCASLHQAHGALMIVGLDGVTEFSEALERLFVMLADGGVALDETTVAAAQEGIAALRGYLDALANGEPAQALRLLPAYRKLLLARDEPEPAAATLFFPDLGQRPPRREAEPPPLAGDKLLARLKMARLGYERGLLKWFKGDAKGLAEMRNAMTMIEATRQTPAERAFWWVALGVFVSLIERGAQAAAADMVDAKRLAMKIGGQIKKLVEGKDQIPERLLAEALYQIAIAPPGAEQVEVVRAAYRLDDLMPHGADADAEAKKPHLRRLREVLAGAKEDWNRLCAGSAAALPPFHEKATRLAQGSDALEHPDLGRLLGALSALADALRRNPARHDEAMALEVATALLLAEHALENFVSLDAGFAHQVDVVRNRLDAVLDGRPLVSMDLPQLDTMSRRAQERLLLATVGREIRNNLSQIEQTLDAFFRAPESAETRAALAGLERPLNQVNGALAVLGQDRACAVVHDCARRIADVRATGGDPAAFEELARMLAGVGFFVEQLETGGQPDIEQILQPLGKSRAEPAPPQAPAGVVPEPAPSMAEVAETPVADAEPTAEDIEAAQLIATVAEPAAEAPPAAPAPAPSAEAERLVDASAQQLDSELLGIFLDEAHEVMSTVSATLPQLHADPADIPTLTTLRRSVHTLKGSGRMVGLNALGEAAWGVEQVLNLWLQSGRGASSALLGMLDQAATLFTDWVRRLDAGDAGAPDAAPLAERCASLLATPDQIAEESAAELVRQLEQREAERAEAELREAELAVAEAMAEASRSQPPAVPPGLTFGDEMPAAAAALEPSPVESTPPVDAPMLEAPTLEVPPVDTSPLEALPVEAMAVELPPEVAPAEPSAEPAPAAPVSDVRPFPAPPPVRIGDVEVAPTLYALYMDEARGHLDAIQQAIAAAGVPGQALIRAAHTLASISGTTGIEAIHTLGRALEQALDRLASSGAIPDDNQRFVLARCAGALEGMLGAVANRRLPNAETDLEAALAALHAHPGATDYAPPPAPAAGRPLPELAPDARQAAEDRRVTRLEDDVDPQLLPLFLEESVELMQAIGADLRAWRASPTDDDIPQRLQRELHTLKGSARMAGVLSCGELLHLMEARIEQAVAARAVSPRLMDGLEASHDRAAALIDRLRRGETALEATATPMPADNVVSIAPAEPDAAAPPVADTATAEAAGERRGSDRRESSAARVHLRVRADLVDALVNEAGEVAIARGRIEEEMHALRAALLELTENVIRLRGQVREIEIQAETQIQAQISQLKARAEEEGVEFDPLEFDRYTRFQELTRMMAESVNDVSTVQHALLKNLDGADASLAAQARLSRELSQRLLAVRMVPFESLAERLHRVVRLAAKECGKRANLDIRGGQTGIDRSVLERIGGPLEHLLRNAVAHGIEAPDAREAAGKPAFGQISLALAQEGNDVVITLADDGGGLDFARIRERARERGLLATGDEPDEQGLIGLVFQSGFSTASEVTTTAGRGVGLDVVKSEVEGLGGRVEMSTRPGQGSSFRLLLPLTLAVSQALVIVSGGQSYALPASMIEQAYEMKPDAIARVRQDGGIDWLGRRYPWHYLPRLMGSPEAQPIPARRHWLLLIKGGSERIAIEIDGLVGNREIVIKAIGVQLERVPGVAGATVLGNGAVALILNPIALAADAATRSATATTQPSHVPALTDSQILRHIAPEGCVMVVDDSLTVRKITGRLLGRQGYRVLTAKDGVDALQQLGEIKPDVMLVDIEMPRMDGFELTRVVRADRRLADIPIIMITSRSADKHRQYALELGVNHYLGKPYDEEELLALVAGHVQHSAAKGNAA